MATLVLLSLLGFLVLFIGAFNQKKILMPVVILGLLAAFVTNAADWDTNNLYYGMMRYDNYAISFSGLMIFSVLMIMLVAAYQFRNEDSAIGDIYALMIFTLVGAIIMTSYASLVMLFVGIEILSIALYILAGSRRMNLHSNEASLKYFLMGSFASGFLLFGIALMYGTAGSFDLVRIADFVNGNEHLPLTFITGVLLIMIGFAFKIGAVPFHFWTPDVYQGTPTLLTAFMATVVKTAGIAAFFHLFDMCFSAIDTVWFNILWAIAVATILLGNISAVMQNEAKRMLAWSSVAHAGYLLLPVLALNELSASSIFYYTAAYSVASILAFTVLIGIAQFNNELPLDQFKGLAKNNPIMTTALIISMFSLAGIPPLAGFFGKYFVFVTAMESNLTIAVLIAVAGSLIGVYYYFRPVILAFNKEVPPVEKIKGSAIYNFVLFAGIVISLLIGIFPGLLANLPGH
ncbi:MAG: NADH-quinone oxidoreductase subunit N [Bacteroidia bacterium]